MIILDKQMLVGKISFVLGEKCKLAWLFCGIMYVFAENSKNDKSLFFSPVALIR
jgi:hypothetical protein